MSGGGSAGGSGGSATTVTVTDPMTNQPVTLVKPDVPMVPSPRVSRLSWLEWKQTTLDLLHLPDLGAVEASVTKDALTGFDNASADLFVADQLRSDLERAAEALADRVTGDPALLTALLPAGAPTSMPDRARAFLAAFGQRAFRRPLQASELDSFVALFQQAPDQFPGVDPFTAGVRLSLQMFLQSPHFLYRTELQAGTGTIALTDYEVASKLSYALTNTMPDDTLFAAAAAGALHDADAVKAQAERLLALPTGVAGLDHFNFQVLKLGNYEGITRDSTAFPEFSAKAPAAMQEEALRFARYIFAQGFGVREIYTKPVAFVNAALAPLYGLQGTFGDDFTQIDLDPNQRAGLLTQTGFLNLYANGNDPDSIHRGVFINDRVLCLKLPPPSANATPLPPEDATLTNRQAIEAHTGTCGLGCHTTFINPAGFAFEGFDAVGKYRTTDRGRTIDSSGSYPFNEPAGPSDWSSDPTQWPSATASHTGAIDFSDQISKSSQASYCYTSQWFNYINRRAPSQPELPLLGYYAARSRAAAISARQLVLELVTSKGFLSRIDEAP